jgi:tRNA modification GTPase
MKAEDTIAAVATPPGRGGIGIIRVSGPEAIRIAGEVFQGERAPEDAPGYSLLYGWAIDGDQKLDEVLCLVMRAPKSYTREDVVEFQCHGGPVPLRRVLEAVLRRGARLAEPGEFTRRAFLHGRIDLSEAEAVADLIQSMTEASARAALSQLSGRLADDVRRSREELLRVLADLEAGIDFPEEDIEFITHRDLQEELERHADLLGKRIEDGRRGRVIREGIAAVIAGRPNVGKSTLMNALLKEDRVIVTPHPGTTRDIVEEALDLDGLTVRLSDTAGVRDSEGSEGIEPEVERESMSRSLHALESADLVLVVLDSSEPLTHEDRVLLDRVPDRPCLILLNKSDLAQRLFEKSLPEFLSGSRVLHISALTGQGLDQLKSSILEMVWQEEAFSAEPPLVTNLRHLEALERARASLRQALSALEENLSEEFISSDLRAAIRYLGEITGESITEDMLDLIFSRFCIGK